LKAAFEHVRAAGGVCIADEVQVLEDIMSFNLSFGDHIVDH
jgi:hypothetical protein